MPVTLYVEQWTRLLDLSDEIKKFIAENESKLNGKRLAEVRRSGSFSQFVRRHLAARNGMTDRVVREGCCKSAESPRRTGVRF